MLLLPILTIAQGLDRPHAIVSGFTVTSNTYPNLVTTGTIVSSDQYALVNFKDSILAGANVNLIFDNTATVPYSMNMYQVTGITITSGNTGTFNLTAINGTPNNFVFPNVASIEQTTSKLELELLDKGETFNTTINKINHNFLKFDELQSEVVLEDSSIYNNDTLLIYNTTGKIDTHAIVASLDTLFDKEGNSYSHLDTLPWIRDTLWESNDTTFHVNNLGDTSFVYHAGIYRYDAGNGVFVTASGLGITADAITGGVQTITIPEGVIPISGRTVNSLTDFTYQPAGSGLINGYRIVFDNTANLFNLEFNGNAKSYDGGSTVSITTRQSAIVNPTVTTSRSVFAGGLTDIIFDNLPANSNAGHDTAIINFK